MKQIIGTSIEQSERLVKAGVNPETAYFEWLQVAHGLMSDWRWELHVRNHPKHWPTQLLQPLKHPSWSYLQLCWLLPEKIVNEHGWTSTLFIKNPLHRNKKKTIIGYKELSSFKSPDVSFSENNPLESVVKLIEWLHKNDHKLNNL